MVSFKKIFACIFFIVGISKLTIAQPSFTVIAYHDVVVNNSQLTGDAITVENLVNHFEWLQANHYHPVSLQQIIDAANNKITLPPKSILLSFDDGYKSVYTKVFPLLKLYQYPAIIALIGNFMEEQDSVQYTSTSKKARTDFLNWNEVIELQQSGLIEVVSHSYNLHKGEISNQQGNKTASATTFIYDTLLHTIETEKNYTARITADLEKSKQQIFANTQQYPLAIVWPYGRYNDITINLAKQANLQASINLNSYANYGVEAAYDINRFYVTANATTDALRDYLENRKYNNYYRFINISTENFIDELNSTQEPKLKMLIDALTYNTTNSIFIPCFYTKNNTAYTLFPNNFIKNENDVLNRVVWQTQSRASVESYLVWDEVVWLSTLKSTESITDFFQQMGKIAPARGVLLKSNSLIDIFINKTPGKKIIESNSIFLREKRRALLTNYNNPSLQALESFQQYQPDIATFLYVSPYNSFVLNDSIIMYKIFNHFSSVLLDLSSISFREAKQQLQNIKVQAQCFSKIFVQLPLVNIEEHQTLLYLLEQKQILNFGFAISATTQIQQYRLPINTRKITATQP
jgi:biofilm PGA synthesis lipoprotein PgaB